MKMIGGEGGMLDPWGSSDIKDYENLFREFGINSFEKFRKRFPENRYVRRGIIFGHRDFGNIAKAIDKKEKFVMMTGLMPSGRFHFGHKMVAEQIIWYQGLGAKTYICAADLESYLMRGIEPKMAYNIGANEYLKNYVALGLTDENVKFWFQSNYRVQYYSFRDMYISNRVTLNELKAIYGELTPKKIFSVLTQVADILHPQLPEFEGKCPSVVPVGADQDPHMRLTRDIASRLSAIRGGPHGTFTSEEGTVKEIKIEDVEFKQDIDLIPPSSTYHKFMQGLQGGKMSSSDPKSYIALTEDPAKAKKKIMSAKTGGRATVEEQKEEGGRPEECMIFELYRFHLIENDKELSEIYERCKAGKLLCGEDKKNCAELVERFLIEHQKKLDSPETERIVDRILKRG